MSPTSTGRDSWNELALTLEGLLPRLWDAFFTPLPPGAVTDLPMGQARTLLHLTLVGRRRMGELADDLGVKVPTVTRMVDRLVEKGLVAREAFEDDRRVVHVCATPAGEDLAAEARAFRRGVIQSRLAGLDDAGREQVLEALRLLERTLRAPRPE
jgi:DNA-binding MarR family transcriptional regulator